MSGSPPDPPRLPFSTWLREQREARQWTRTELARRAACTRIMIDKLERGERLASSSMFTLLLRALEIPATEWVAYGAWYLGFWPTPVPPPELPASPFVGSPVPPPGAAEPTVPPPLSAAPQPAERSRRTGATPVLLADQVVEEVMTRLYPRLAAAQDAQMVAIEARLAVAQQQQLETVERTYLLFLMEDRALERLEQEEIAVDRAAQQAANRGLSMHVLVMLGLGLLLGYQHTVAVLVFAAVLLPLSQWAFADDWLRRQPAAEVALGRLRAAIFVGSWVIVLSAASAVLTVAALQPLLFGLPK